MKSWLSVDDQGRTVLMRQGTGQVVAVAPIGLSEPFALYRVEIEVTRPKGAPRAIRLSTHGTITAADPLLELAREVEGRPEEMAWQIAWHRLPWVPEDLDITSLDLVNEAQAWLRCLVPSSSPEAGSMAQEAESFAAFIRAHDGPLGQGRQR